MKSNFVKGLIYGTLIFLGIVCVISLATAIFFFFSPRTREGNDKTLQVDAYTNADTAFFHVTNFQSYPQYWCARGVVVSKSGTKVISSPVCTGAVQPHESKDVEARYSVGAVKELCKGEGVLGLVDWDRCDFVYVEEK